MVEPYKVSSCPFRNGGAIDWSSVGTWFGTCSVPGVRMWAWGLVYQLLVAQTMWFGMPNVCTIKQRS